MCRRPVCKGAAQQAPPQIITANASPEAPWANRPLGIRPSARGPPQVLTAYSLESGDFGVGGAVKRAVRTTVLARSHVKHQGFELVARLTGGRHCRPPPDPLLPRSSRPKVRGRGRIPGAGSSRSTHHQRSRSDVGT